MARRFGGRYHPPELRGTAYGLRQPLDSVGAFLGPLLAVVFMAVLANDVRAGMWVAVLLAFIPVGLVGCVRDRPHSNNRTKARPSLSRKPNAWSLGYWLIVFLGRVFTLARFSETFLVLRAQSVGLSVGLVLS